MKILFASITDSGILRVRSELISELLVNGHEIVIVTPKDSDYQKLLDMGCKYIPVSIQQHGVNPLADLILYKKYKEILKNERPDIVLLFTTKPNVYCGIACRKLRIPVVMNITGMGSALGNKGIVQTVLIHLYKVACNGNNMKKIFFQNDSSKEFFLDHSIGIPSIYQRIPGSGVNLQNYSVQPFPTGDTVDFLFIARIMKQKGIDEYLEAARIIRQNHVEAIFHVLGSCDEEYKSIVEKESKIGTIIYHGKVNNILDYQRLSQCTIHPSYYPEGMSNVILEAAASGRMIITTDHPGCREGVDDGITGLIIPAKNPKALVNAIEKVLSMNRETRCEMGLKGRQKIEKEFDRKYVTKAYLDVIQEK